MIRPTRRRRRPEQSLQMSVAAFLGHALKPPTIWTAIGHGGGGAVRGAILKGMGVKAGWPDIIVVSPAVSAPWPKVIGIELKAAKGGQSKEQKDIELAFGAAWCAYAVCRNIAEVEHILRRANVPLHATTLRRAT